MATAGLATNFRIRNATDFLNYIQSESENRAYIFLGKITEWPDEQSPPIAQNDTQELFQTWRDINGISKISANDVTLGIREVIWQRGTVYSQYEDDTDLTGKDFFVLTNQLNVYKCISNNNGAPSTVLPSHTTFDIPLQSDGYKWKYMFSVTTSLLRKFIVPGFFAYDPDPLVIANAQPGTIDNLRVESSGSGYPALASASDSNEIPVFIEGNGDQNESANVSINTIQGQIISVVGITSQGSNYPYAPEQNIPVAIRQYRNSGVVQTAYGIASTNPSGGIETVEIVIGGTGYSDGSAEVVQSSCRAYAETNADGEIINSDVATGREGQNFTQARAIVVNNSGTGAELKPIISPFLGHGADPATELLANFVLVNLRLSGGGGFLGADDFRRIGILEDPVLFDSQQSDGSYLEFTGTEGDTKYRLNLNGGDNSGFIAGERIIGQSSGAIGIETTLFGDSQLRTSLDESITALNSFEVNEIVVGETSGTQDTISAITNPDIELYRGDILYINNREVTQTQSPQQIETITLVLEY